jgi:hypothetical protein
MKISKSILASLIFLLVISISAIAQSDAKVIAVVNHASWCPACVGNSERAQVVFSENNRDGAIQFVVNDLSTDESKKASADVLKEHGLLEAMEANKTTGIAYFFNAETKELINKVSVAKSNEEISSAMETARKGSK